MHIDFENLLNQIWLMLRRQFYDVFSSKCLCVSAMKNAGSPSELEHQCQK